MDNGKWPIAWFAYPYHCIETRPCNLYCVVLYYQVRHAINQSSVHAQTESSLHHLMMKWWHKVGERYLYKFLKPFCTLNSS